MDEMQRSATNNLIDLKPRLKVIPLVDCTNLFLILCDFDPH
jgi:hypothetical protein